MVEMKINLSSKITTIYVGNGLTETLDKFYVPQNECLLITDSNIPKSVVDKVIKQWPINHVITLQAGESNKSLSIYESIISTMLDKGFSKATTLIGLGGGVIGDLTGFIASTFYRGIECIFIPTSLISMVDASIGGKTALNINTHKNIIGSFYPPSMVFIDPFLLSSLPKREYNSGFAEIIKMALIKDKNLFYQLFESVNIESVIIACLNLKKAIVEKDPTDMNIRQILNYGHTIGHALESIHYQTFLHGECIAVGMKMMARGQRFEEELTSLLNKYDININIPYQEEVLMEHIHYDKKRHGNKINIAMVEMIGEGYVKKISVSSFRDYIRRNH